MANLTTILPQPVPALITSYPRSVVYTAANGETVELNYCNYTVSSRQLESARGVIKRAYRFSFQFIISTDGMANYNTVVTYVERVLMQRAGTLVITDGANEIYRCGPAGGITLSVPRFNLTSAIRPTFLADIEWGPKPVSVSIQPIGVGGYGEWVVEVMTGSEDAFVVGDVLILGVDSEVSYSMDKNHYTTRTIVGRAYCANWGRNATSPFAKAPLSYVDQKDVRLAILGTAQAGLTKRFMDPITIPPNFERLQETFTVDNTENILGFVIVDREKYRMMPQYITDAACQISVSADAASQVSYLRHAINGYCEAPRDVDKGRVLQACMEQIQDALGPLLFRSSNELKAFVYSHTFTNDAYANRIAYQILALSPFGDFNFFNSIGVNNFRSSVFFAQGTGGSAQLSGSGYRRPGAGGNGSRTDNSPGIGTPPPDKEVAAVDATDEQLRQAIKESSELTQFPYDTTSPPTPVITHHVEAHVHESNETTVAVPSTVGAEAVPYARTEPTYNVTVGTTIISIHERNSTSVNYMSRVNLMCSLIPGLTYIGSEVADVQYLGSPLGQTQLTRYMSVHRFKMTAELRRKIIAAGGIQAFINMIESAYFDSNATLQKKIEAFLTAGTSYNANG